MTTGFSSGGVTAHTMQSASGMAVTHGDRQAPPVRCQHPPVVPGRTGTLLTPQGEDILLSATLAPAALHTLLRPWLPHHHVPWAQGGGLCPWAGRWRAVSPRVVVRVSVLYLVLQGLLALKGPRTLAAGHQCIGCVPHL